MRSPDQKDEAPELAGDGGSKVQRTADSTNSAGAGQAKQAAVCKLPRLRSDLHRVGAGLAVRFTSSGADLGADWTPRPPTKREWKRVGDRYRAARHQFLSVLAAHVGGTVAVVEMPAGGVE